MLNLCRCVVGVVAVLLVVSGSLGSTLLGQQSESSGPAQSRMSSEEVLRLSLQFVDFLAVLREVRDLQTAETDLDQMLINNRYSVNKLNNHRMTVGELWRDAHYPTDSMELLLTKTVQSFRLAKLAQTNDAFALLRRLSEATSEDDIRTLPGDVAVMAGEIDELWRQLPLLGVSLSYVLVDTSRVVNDRTPYLRLTSQHITTLSQRLKEIFASGDSDFPLEFTASLLYDFLDSDYKAADEQ
jgi:hypothetical protein